MDEQALESVRKAGAIAAEARDLGVSLVDDGITLASVAEEVEALILKRGAGLAFPTNISINDVAAHFTPNADDAQKFQTGDVVKVDVGAHVNGYIGDTAATVEVRTKNWAGLIEASARALKMATEMIADGTPVGAIGGTVQRSILETGYRPVNNLNGHEMKQYNLHAGLSIPNIDDGSAQRIHTGMIVAVEPFATNGQGHVLNSKPGNIYRIIRDRPLRDPAAAKMFEQMKTRFNSLPFCERWCDDLDPNASHQLKVLLRHGVISSYAILKETDGSRVSQAEHTLVIVNGKCEITTRSR
ncbi:MAG: Methionine aminopeptidase [Methanomassiliicoccales archaeon PtaU1.Bin124]|nr:MAG: Methionine aminopeptidase [Methanomassiliicoccales archaeon PtaU1.Bin124]